MPREAVRLDIRDEAHVEAAVREAGVLLRAGTPVLVFAHAGHASVLAFRAKPVDRGYFIISAEAKRTGTWPDVTSLLEVAGASVGKAFRDLGDGAGRA